ncbi:MAG: GGDEF domain-containing protein [Idiomarina sp.]|nr:GGDEF domain-containing protein [Idiomarina sp.]
MIAIDFDHFKELNDQFGHALGDKVLEAFGEALNSCSRDTDICARMGGDEFFWIQPHSSVNDARKATERLRERFTEQLKPLEVECSLSIGIQLHSMVLDDNLLLAADKTMYRAKVQGRATTVVDGKL